jgi:hypothetical protein
VNRFEPGQARFDRRRDAYLEPWGRQLAETFELAMQVGTVAHAMAWLRHSEAMPVTARPSFDETYRTILRRAQDALHNA